MRLPSASPWPAVVSIQGPGGDSGFHAHHALHLLLCTGGALRIRTRERGAGQTACGVLTAPDVPHAIDARGAEVALVFVDPESAVGAALHGSMGAAPVRLFDEKERDALLAGGVNEAIARLAGDASRARAMHPRVRRVLRAIHESPPGADVSLASLAAIASLSEGRLMHAFTESVGIPLRPYLSWLKVQRAAAAMAKRAPLARAAIAGGFADAAHMSRTFKRMFGMTPAMLRSQLVAP
jgi:AraC-like DNA-binding protein